jgi:hypothetical protein
MANTSEVSVVPMNSSSSMETPTNKTPVVLQTLLELNGKQLLPSSVG